MIFIGNLTFSRRVSPLVYVSRRWIIQPFVHRRFIKHWYRIFSLHNQSYFQHPMPKKWNAIVAKLKSYKCQGSILNFKRKRNEECQYKGNMLRLWLNYLFFFMLEIQCQRCLRLKIMGINRENWTWIVCLLVSCIFIVK